MSLARTLPWLLLLWAAGSAAGQDTPPAPSDVRIMGVAVIGNKATKERIILREVLVKENDTVPAAALYTLLERSRQNLMNTGLFNTVTVLPVYLDMRHALVEVTVNERWTIWPSPIFQLADPNFNTWWSTFQRDPDRVNYGVALTKYNFRGRNETVQARVQFGYARQFALRYKVPNIDRRQRWGLSIGGGYIEQAEVTAGTVGNKRILIRDTERPNRTQRKADAELSLRRAHDIRHYFRIGFTHADVGDSVTATAIDYFNGAATATRFLQAGYGITWDRRDLRFFPREGHLAELRVDRFGLGVAEEHAPDITTAFASIKKWWRVSDPVTLAFSARGKRTWGTPPYYVQEGLGYANLVRGYEYYVIDGEHFALTKANLAWQLLRPRTERVEAMPHEAFRTLYVALYLNLFVDGGRVWDSRYAADNDLAGEWLSGYGAGLDLVTSYDLVARAEYTLNALGQHGFFLHFTQPF